MVLQMAQSNNGTVTSQMVKEKGIARQYLKQLVDKGQLERISRGIYLLPHVWEDELEQMQLRFKKGIYSRETALFLHDLTDRTPVMYSMTFPIDYNLTTVKQEGILATRSKKDFYELGIEEVQSPAGNVVRAYNAEKTLCDILRPRSGVESGVVAEAFKRYSVKVDKNIILLSEYSKMLKVEEKVRTYLEVLL
ncbi:type IV toxin-antitoxin system AbiEi family antitoxin domain-containing protein [Streptococcus oralis]|nr:type IV toxin-antitoxin system AbiEi family antitoxin domain-containing protein [Streptococcus oralis]